LTRLSSITRHRPTSPQRGFLLWRLSDAGRRTSGAVPQAAGIRNPSQQRTFVGDPLMSPRCQQRSHSHNNQRREVSGCESACRYGVVGFLPELDGLGYD